MTTAAPSRARWFVLPLLATLAVVGVALGLWRWWFPADCAAYVSQDFFDVDGRARCVSVEGTAHYEVVLTQVIAGNGFFDDKTHYIFPLFPPGNTDEREIRLLVRTERRPERLVSYETMTLSGTVGPLDRRKVPFDAEQRFAERSPYFYADQVRILEPDRVEVSGEATWERER